MDYVTRRTAEGKSKREIIRCLKRYVAREIYHALTPAPAQQQLRLLDPPWPSRSAAAPDPTTAPESVLDIYRSINALAESFVASFKTELISDRVWRTREPLEFAIVEHLGWFNHDRLHSSLGDIPPAEFEALYAPNFFSQAYS
jgi:putative transposase